MNAKQLMSLPIVEWQAALEGDTQGERSATEDELSALIQRAALLEAYIARRFNTGCGDQGHASSAEHARRVLIRVRKALGYSYPRNTPARIP